MALLVALLAITTLSLMPVRDIPVTTFWDKLDHWLAFFALSFLANHAFPSRSFWRHLAPALLVYGIAIEVAQSFTPDRQADGFDVIADAIGILIYGVLLQWRRRSSNLSVAK